MKILNVDFLESVEWTKEIVLNELKKANPTRTETELKALIKASKLVKNELQTTTTKGNKGKKSSSADNRDADNIQ